MTQVALRPAGRPSTPAPALQIGRRPADKRPSTAIAADGQVTLGDTVLKQGAKKLRRLAEGKVVAGFAGSTADAQALFARFETKLQEFRGNLERAAVEGCDLNNSLWRRANLGHARITGSKLTGGDFRECRSLDLTLADTLLVACRLPGLSFHKSRLKGLDFSDADLAAADFRQTEFEGCSLRGAHVVGAKFQGADLRGADLGGIRLADAALFRGATISRAQAATLLGELGLIVG